MTECIECETLEELIDYLVKIKVPKDEPSHDKSARLEPEKLTH